MLKSRAGRASEALLNTFSLFGVKTDANPGRLNSTTFNLFLPGIYYGHCSEICGVLLFFGVLASFFCIYIINNNNTGKMGQEYLDYNF